MPVVCCLALHYRIPAPELLERRTRNRVVAVLYRPPRQCPDEVIAIGPHRGSLHSLVQSTRGVVQDVVINAPARLQELRLPAESRSLPVAGAGD